MRYIIKRNLLVFFRDKASVFFSLLSVFIIIGLYVLFLGDMLVKSLPDMTGVRFLMDSWIMAGLLAVTPITTVMGNLGFMITDKKYKLIKDFSAAPIKRSALAGGYIISSFIISLVLTLLTLVLAEIYIVMYGGELLTIDALLKVIGLILFVVMFSCFMMFFIVSFIKSLSAFSVASTILGTLIGFLTGIYIPVGNLPTSVQTVVKIFPPSHAGVLFRKVMMKQAEAITFAGAPKEAIDEFNRALGVTFQVSGKDLSPMLSILYLIIVTIIFMILSIKIISRKETK